MPSDSDRLSVYQRIERERTEAVRKAQEGPPCRYARKYQAGCCDKAQFMCQHPSRYGRSYDAAQCNPGCPEYMDGSLSLSVVIPARNEGDEVWRTCASVADGSGSWEHEVILIDDGSWDGSCDFASSVRSTTLIRNDEPQGVGRCRSVGAAQSHGDVLIFADAHMRFPFGGLGRLSDLALQHRAIVCASSVGMEEDSIFHAWGADLIYDPGELVRGLFRCDEPDARISEVPAPMGATYAMSRITAMELAGPTGLLWDNVAGVWGFSEQGLAIKAHLLGIPVLVARDIATKHKYRSANPAGDGAASEGYWRNAAYCLALYLQPKTFATYAAEILHANMAGDSLARCVASTRGRCDKRWARDDETVFTELLRGE